MLQRPLSSRPPPTPPAHKQSPHQGLPCPPRLSPRGQKSRSARPGRVFAHATGSCAEPGAASVCLERRVPRRGQHRASGARRRRCHSRAGGGGQAGDRGSRACLRARARLRRREGRRGNQRKGGASPSALRQSAPGWRGDIRHEGILTPGGAGGRSRGGRCGRRARCRGGAGSARCSCLNSSHSSLGVPQCPALTVYQGTGVQGGRASLVPGRFGTVHRSGVTWTEVSSLWSHGAVSARIQQGPAQSCAPILCSVRRLELLTATETFLSYAEMKKIKNKNKGMIAGQIPCNSFTRWQNLPRGVYCVSKRAAGVCWKQFTFFLGVVYVRMEILK